jgi:hypothetical protein
MLLNNAPESSDDKDFLYTLRRDISGIKSFHGPEKKEYMREIEISTSMDRWHSGFIER